MPEQQFDKREVARSIRRFRDLSNDAAYGTRAVWFEVLRRMIDFCESDPIMKTVTDPLRSNPNVDVRAWYQQVMLLSRGEGQYRLPLNDDDRTALLYQVIKGILAEEFSLHDMEFAIMLGIANDLDGSARFGNDQFVSKFTREMEYRLSEIETDIHSYDVVPASVLMVFNVNVHGNVHNSNVAVGGIITDSTSSPKST